jgi:hypothetical protein
MMTINPHPIVLAVAAEQRRANLLMEADRQRLAREAAGHGIGCRPWRDLSETGAVATLLALLLALTRQG